MRKVVLVVGSMALAILLAGGVAQAIINGQPDRGSVAHPYVGALVSFWCEMGEQMPVVVCSPICLGLWSASSITQPPMFEL